MKTKTFHEFHEYWDLIVNNKPGKKACLSGEGVDVRTLHRIHCTGCFTLTDLPTFKNLRIEILSVILEIFGS